MEANNKMPYNKINAILNIKKISTRRLLKKIDFQ